MILHSPIDYRQLENSCRYFFMSSCVCCMHAADFLIYLTSGHVQCPVCRQSSSHDPPCHSRPVSRSVLHLSRKMKFPLPMIQSPLLPILRPFYHDRNAATPLLLSAAQRYPQSHSSVSHAGRSPFHIPSTHSAPVHPVQLPNFCIKKVQHRAFTLCAVPHVKEKEEQ